MTTPKGPGSFLGDRQATGALTTGASQFSNPYGLGLWTAAFTPQVLAFSANLVECYHIALEGPSGSQLKVYLDQTFYDATPRGDLNSYDPKNPLLLRGGQSLVFHWNSSATPAPLVTTWWRLPLVTYP